MTADATPDPADLIHTGAAYDAALHDLRSLHSDSAPEVDAIAAHVDALTAALHHTDVARLHLDDQVRDLIADDLQTAPTGRPA